MRLRTNVLHTITICLFLNCACLTIFPAFVNSDPLTVADFIKLAPDKGQFSIDAYVVKKYSCPACPSDSICKPCIQNHVLLSDSNVEIDNYPESGNFLIVNTDQDLNIHSRYKLQIEILNTSSNNLYSHDIRLINAHAAELSE